MNYFRIILKDAYIKICWYTFAANKIITKLLILFQLSDFYFVKYDIHSIRKMRHKYSYHSGLTYFWVTFSSYISAFHSFKETLLTFSSKLNLFLRNHWIFEIRQFLSSLLQTTTNMKYLNKITVNTYLRCSSHYEILKNILF